MIIITIYDIIIIVIIYYIIIIPIVIIVIYYTIITMTIIIIITTIHYITIIGRRTASGAGSNMRACRQAARDRRTYRHAGRHTDRQPAGRQPAGEEKATIWWV